MDNILTSNSQSNNQVQHSAGIHRPFPEVSKGIEYDVRTHNSRCWCSCKVLPHTVEQSEEFDKVLIHLGDFHGIDGIFLCHWQNSAR